MERFDMVRCSMISTMISRQRSRSTPISCKILISMPEWRCSEKDSQIQNLFLKHEQTESRMNLWQTYRNFNASKSPIFNISPKKKFEPKKTPPKQRVFMNFQMVDLQSCKTARWFPPPRAWRRILRSRRRRFFLGGLRHSDFWGWKILVNWRVS